ncbi:amino acid kinase family protein [Amycolatopsis sp. NPDC004747]
MTADSLYNRVVLKISGESLSFAGTALHPRRFDEVAMSIAEVHDLRIGVIVVTGGGNIWRGAGAAGWQISPTWADMIGMYGTGFNIAALAARLEHMHLPVETLTRGNTTGLGDPYTTTKLGEALDHGKIVLIAGGMGVTGVSTDVAAVSAAIDAHADAVIMAKYGVDGVYDRDPRRTEGAVFLPELTVSDALAKKLAVMDATALTMAQAGKVPIHVIPADETSGVRYVIEGKKFGSKILPE